ncbi:MAG: cation:proton antiporter [Gammaproteobacteria bacterium]|nr:cation:proton antiporter [Gammaproteobacteria bacterium]
MFDSMLLIFVASAVLASLALFCRQPLIVVYIVVGCVLGPHGLQWVTDHEVLSEMGHIGVIFLLFIVGLDLPPQKIKSVLGQSIVTVAVSTLVFFVVGAGIGILFGFTVLEAAITGIAVVFSSTIVGIKLLPKTVLHHRHVGEIVIGLLLLQDLLAVFALLYMKGLEGSFAWHSWLIATLGVPGLAALAFVCAKYLFWPLLRRFDVFTEFTFLLFLGWCMGVAWIAHLLGLPVEVGAFLAGVVLANLQASQGIAQTLEPLRDFFLVLFFFYVGASVDPRLLWELIWQVLVLGAVLVALKPVVFRYLIGWQGETASTSWEIGARLGQCSEFSLLVLYLAVTQMSESSMLIVLGASVMTILISSYIVVFKFKNPIAISDRLRVD